MDDKILQLGLVGVGKIARDQHVPAIAAHPGLNLAATASPRGRIDGVPGHADLDAMMAAHPDLDAIILCTPPAIRAGLALRALAAGKHVMLEKPPPPRCRKWTRWPMPRTPPGAP
jgi:predicted dehydrogenase